MPSAAEDPGARDRDTPDLVDHRYQVVRVLGEDRLGRTLEVRDQQADNLPLALTLIWSKYSADSNFGSRVSECVNTARNIIGDHVNRVRNSATEGNDRYYLTADLVEGESLHDRLTREDTLQPRHALEIARQLLGALTVGHEKNVMHGEITPANILLANAEPKTSQNPYGVNVQLLRFGLTELSDVEGAERADTRYLSPEGAEGKAIDPRSDVFSVGLICCEMLVGKRVFQSGLGESIREAVSAENNEKLAALLRDLPPGGFDLISRALQKDRERRYPTAAKFQSALASCPLSREIVRTPVSVEIAIVLLVIFGIAASWFAWNQHGQVSESRGLLALRTEELNERVAELKDGDAAFVARAVKGATARAFDAFLSLVEAHRPVGSFALLGPITETEGGTSGMLFLTFLDRAATTIQEAKEVPDAQVREQLSERAKSLLDECDSLRGSFGSEAESWLSYSSREDAEPKRLQRLDAVLASLRARLEDLESGSDLSGGASLQPGKGPTPPSAESVDELWKSALAAGPDEDPSAAFELADEGEDDLDPRLLELTTEYCDGLKGRVLVGSKLNQVPLAKEPQLESWTALLEKTPGAAAWPAAREIRLLGYARRFFHEGDDGPFPWAEVYEPSESGGMDWRHDFYLRARLVESTPWVLQSLDRVQVYVRNVGDRRTFLRSESGGRPSETECFLAVSVVNPAGDEITSLRLRIHREGRQYEWGMNRIDLVKDSARIETVEPARAEGVVPRQAGARPEDLETFRAEFAKLNPLQRQCLVFESAGRSVWLSPRFGLVRLIEGESVQEVICSKEKQ